MPRAALITQCRPSLYSSHFANIPTQHPPSLHIPLPFCPPLCSPRRNSGGTLVEREGCPPSVCGLRLPPQLVSWMSRPCTTGSHLDTFQCGLMIELSTLPSSLQSAISLSSLEGASMGTPHSGSEGGASSTRGSPLQQSHLQPFKPSISKHGAPPGRSPGPLASGMSSVGS